VPEPAPGAPGASAATTQTSAVLPASDATATTQVARSAWEPRPANATANQTVPTSDQLATFRAQGNNWGSCETTLRHKVTGQYTGTTDEILQWAAAKWGFSADLMRAVAVAESYWNQAALGDGGLSFGLMQIKKTASPGTYPMSSTSTAFNVDYFAGTLRYYLNGCATWMNNQAGHVGTYAAGDLWGSIGAWFSGNWHTAAAEDYIANIKGRLAVRAWSKTGF
jgi:autotransporter family porin